MTVACSLSTTALTMCVSSVLSRATKGFRSWGVNNPDQMPTNGE